MISFKISQPHGNGTLLRWKSVSDYPAYYIRNEGRDLVVELKTSPLYTERRVVSNFFGDAYLKSLSLYDDGSLYQGSTLLVPPLGAVPNSNLKLILGGDLDPNGNPIPWPGPVGGWSRSGIHSSATIEHQWDFLGTDQPLGYRSYYTHYLTPLGGLLAGPKDQIEPKSNFSDAFNYPWIWTYLEYPQQRQVRLYRVSDGSIHRPLGTLSYTPTLSLVWAKSWPANWPILQISTSFTYQGEFLLALLTSDSQVSVMNQNGDYLYLLQDKFSLSGIQSIQIFDTSLYWESLTGPPVLITLQMENNRMAFYDLDTPRGKPLTEIDLLEEMVGNSLPPGPWILETVRVISSDSEIDLEVVLKSWAHGRRYLRLDLTESEIFYWLSDSDTSDTFWSGDLPSEEYEVYWIR